MHSIWQDYGSINFFSGEGFVKQKLEPDGPGKKFLSEKMRAAYSEYYAFGLKPHVLLAYDFEKEIFSLKIAVEDFPEKYYTLFFQDKLPDPVYHNHLMLYTESAWSKLAGLSDPRLCYWRQHDKWAVLSKSLTYGASQLVSTKVVFDNILL